MGLTSVKDQAVVNEGNDEVSDDHSLKLSSTLFSFCTSKQELNLQHSCHNSVSRAFLRFVFERNEHVLLFTESKTAHAELLRFVAGTTMSTTIVMTATSTAGSCPPRPRVLTHLPHVVNFFNFVSSGSRKVA